MSDQNLFSPGPAAEHKYELLMELGRGGMGVANLAVSRGPQGFAKLVVLKTMRRQLVGDAASHRMFLEEANLSARLNHPNVVHVFEVTEYDHAPTMVMEYLEGQTLWQILHSAGDSLPLPLHLHILTKVLCGLHAAHELRDFQGQPLNLIHRDVSPHNVSVLFDGQVKVLDFGIAKAASSEIETQAGTFKGKVRYMPPEQMVRGEQDRRVDVFAVGVMLWEAIMKRRYWGDMPETDVISNLVARRLPPLPPRGETLPHQLRFICAQALAADPEDRYPTAAEFQRALEDYLLVEPERAFAEDDLAAFMTRHFDAERQTARALIGSHLQEAKTDGRITAQIAAEASEPAPALLMPTRKAGSEHEAETRLLGSSASPETKTPSEPRGPAAPEPAATAPPSPVAPPAEAAPSSVPAADATSAPAVEGPRPKTGRRSRGALRDFFAYTLVGLVVGTLTLFGFTAREIVDAMQLDGTAQRCGAGLKSCGGQCVSIDDPAYGCGLETCDACNVPNAGARCNRHGACDVAVCYAGFDDCDTEGKNGCETNVRTDPDHCTSCERRCPALRHAQRGCGDACTVWRCDEGFRDCNGAASDGCEVDARSDAENCGRCGHACGSGEICRDGACR